MCCCLSKTAHCLGLLYYADFPGGSVVKIPPVNTGNVGDVGLIPGLGRSLEEGKGYPLQYSGLENSVEKSLGSQRVGHN